MDSELLTMPPAGLGEESEEDRRKRLVLASRMPPASVAPSQPRPQPATPSTMPPAGLTPQPRSDAFSAPPATGSGLVKSYAPGSPEYDAALKGGPPTMPPASVKPPEAAPAASAPPTMPPAKFDTVGLQPHDIQPAANVMPPVTLGPGQKREQELREQGRPGSPEGPKLPWWKRALDIAGSLDPFGRLIEKQIPGSPQNFDWELARATAGANQERGEAKSKQEAETAKGNTKEARQAYLDKNPDLRDEMSDFQRHDFILTGKMPQKEPAPPPEHQDIVKEFSDALAKGDTARMDALAPRVQKFLEMTKPQKEQPDKVDKKIDEFVDPQNNRINVMQRPDGSTYNVARGQSRAEAGVAGPSDIKDVAAGIKDGIDPPDLMKYGYRDRTAIAAELKRQGFDLAKADQDWHATQKHLATLNGAQQERLRQAVSFTNDSLGILDGLYNQWQKVGPTSGWKVFNKASLATSKQLPGEAGNLAHRLEAQIADLTSELGTVYKGGNSSTDESLKLAAKNLEADWNEQTFKNAINQIRQNLEIRNNSIRHSQPAGVSANSPYTPKGETETPKDFGEANGKPEGTTGKLPDGTKVIVKAGRIVAQ